MANAATLKAHDLKKALFTENSIICINGEYDIFLKGVEKAGRRWIARLDRFNSNGVQVSGFIYISELTKAIKSGHAVVMHK